MAYVTGVTIGKSLFSAALVIVPVVAVLRVTVAVVNVVDVVAVRDGNVAAVRAVLVVVILVDVVLGEGYTDLVAAPTEEQLVAAMEPVEDCVPVETFQE